MTALPAPTAGMAPQRSGEGVLPPRVQVHHVCMRSLAFLMPVMHRLCCCRSGDRGKAGQRRKEGEETHQTQRLPEAAQTSPDSLMVRTPIASAPK